MCLGGFAEFAAAGQTFLEHRSPSAISPATTIPPRPRARESLAKPSSLFCLALSSLGLLWECAASRRSLC